jgi:transcription initiation factor TFIID subunit 1
MKGIFLRAGESAAEKLAEIEARPKSAHKYNVAEQQQIYKEEVRKLLHPIHLHSTHIHHCLTLI